MERKQQAMIGLGLGAVALGILALTEKAEAIPPEEIVLSGLVISPPEVYVGEPVSISVLATNIGEVAGSYEVTCEVI